MFVPGGDHTRVCLPRPNRTFTTAEGARLGGSPSRGLDSFRVMGLSETLVEIGEMGEDVLLFS